MDSYTLYETSLYRYFHTQDVLKGRYLTQSFMDEHRKITTARYKVVEVDILPKTITFIYKLDARSLRNMRRKKVIENKPPGVHKEEGILPMKVVIVGLVIGNHDLPQEKEEKNRPIS